MSSGKAGGRAGSDDRSSILADPARLELLDLPLLEKLVTTPLISGGTRALHLLEQALMLREIARRNGRRPRLLQAGALAERAAQAARDNPQVFAAARLQQAHCALERGRLFADEDGPPAAHAHLKEVERTLVNMVGRFNGPNLLRARLVATQSLALDDRTGMCDALSLFETAITAAEARFKATGAHGHDLALAKSERAELLITMGQRFKDATLLQRAARDLAALCDQLEPNYLPLSLCRAETLRGAALRALGDCTGEARLMKEAAGAYRAALDAVPIGHSPLDRARAAHGLGLALQGMAEIAGDPRLYPSAIHALDRALADLPTEGLPLRAVVVHHRAALSARQAERNGDIPALAEAEATFKAELSQRSAQNDPVAWAVTQVALARIYEVRADLTGRSQERLKAGFALTEALDVFAERGLKSLSDVAQAALDRLKGARSAS
jgi:tetratricopeptide (TPR) repeat protein